MFQQCFKLANCQRTICQLGGRSSWCLHHHFWLRCHHPKQSSFLRAKTLKKKVLRTSKRENNTTKFKECRSTIFDILATGFGNMYRRIGRKQGCWGVREDIGLWTKLEAIHGIPCFEIKCTTQVNVFRWDSFHL